MPYSEKEFKISNVNYLNKDFDSLKNTLVEYAKAYFPNTYKDFNETSPGMMLIEMSAYVGDVLSFYIDQQYKEMLLPLAEERRNVINIAKMLGYKVKPNTPAFANITITQTVGATGPITNKIPNYSSIGTAIVPTSTQITSISDPSQVFETLGVVDFTISSSNSLPPVQSGFDSDGVVNEFILTRQTRAVSGKTKETTFNIGTPTKFLKLNLPDNDIVEILSCTDSNGNKWYAVDYLAQDKVPINTHYQDDPTRGTNAYLPIGGVAGTDEVEMPVPYTLSYLQTSKRFVVEVDEDNTTSLVFGNGILRTGQILGSAYSNIEQAGYTIPGNPSELDMAVNPLLGDNTSTLGEAPAHVIMTVSYRVGGGIGANLPSGDLSSVVDGNLTVTNNTPAQGGSSGESIEEIRHKALAHFASQNRAVTKEDYEARIMNMDARFGVIAKVYVEREDSFSVSLDDAFAGGIADIASGVGAQITELESTAGYLKALGADLPYTEGNLLGFTLQDIANSLGELMTSLGAFSSGTGLASVDMGTLKVHLLTYDINKNLTTLTTAVDNTIIHPLKNNIQNYLSQYKILTDELIIQNGKVINFGVVFEVYASRGANKEDIKLRCIEKIREYFNIDKMQFRQALYTSQIEYELMNVDGVRGVNHITITQDSDYRSGDSTQHFTPPLWNTQFDDSSGTFTTGGGKSGYGYKYNFEDAFNDGILLPSVEPAVFELKEPNKNIIGVVK